MSRNSSGTYTLPSGNPVVSGTLIEASWANTTLDDLASAMTDSLSRTGQGGMQAALRLYDGTSSVPGLAWGSETTTGWYRAGAGDMRLVVTGSEVMKYLATGVAITGTLSATGNFAINTDKFTVAASSGNTVVAGTLAVTGASTFTGAATFNATTTTFENATAYYPQLINRNKTADANGSYIVLEKVRNTSIVQNGDVLGNLIFRGYDGAAYLQGAFINAVVSAAPGTNDMPTDLVFGTTPDGSAGPSERLRISSTGAGTASADWTFYGVKVGRGAGSVATNTAVGASALAANTTGPSNTAVGDSALAANTSGPSNTAFGRLALNANTTGGGNTSVGYHSLEANTTAFYNTAMGESSLRSNTTGANNSAFGQGSLFSNTTASNNTAVGYNAQYNTTTGADNTSLGYQAGNNIQTGVQNTYLGSQAAGNTSGGHNYNVGIGYRALYGVSSGEQNVVVGHVAGQSLTSGSFNTAIGRAALQANTTASNNTAVGYQAAYSTTTGQTATAFGARALYSNTTGADNVAVGYAALYGNTTGSYNVAVGPQALNANATAYYNTAVGYQSLSSNTGQFNTALGFQTGYNNTTASYQVSIGYQAMGSGVGTGFENNAIGYKALYTLSSSSNNNAFGSAALTNLTTADNNTAIGHNTLLSTTTGGNNTALGYKALYSNTTGASSTALGYLAGYSNTTSAGGTFVGTNAGYSATGSAGNNYNTLIGYNAGYYITTGVNNTVLGGYNGNQGGLNITTSTGYIVLSDGAGNPRNYIDSSGYNYLLGASGGRIYFRDTSNTAQYSIQSTAGTFYIFSATNYAYLVGTSFSSWTFASDARIKENIVDLDYGLDTVLALKPRRFDYISNKQNDIGFIAQEVKKVVPEAATGSEIEFDEADTPEERAAKTMGVSKDLLIPVLVKAIQELNAKVDAQAAEIATLKGN